LAPPLFEHRLRITPEAPGVYTMRDAKNNVLYVGKANILRNRLHSYFGSTDSLSPKIQQMVSRINDFEVIVTDTAAEAIFLENTLIKRYKPPYNSRLKDDKTYPYLKIDLSEEFPRVYITRRKTQDGARYFGPFASAGSIRKTMDTLNKLFPYRSCTKVITGKDPRPCLEYYINRCIAPCTGNANKEEYLDVIQQVIKFMEGNTETIIQNLREKMEGAVEQLNYERAAVLRDQIRSIERVAEEQRIKVDSNPVTDMDVIAMAAGKNETWVEVFFIQHGKLIGREHFFMSGTQDDHPRNVLGQFIKQFYQAASAIPPRILLQHPPEDQEIICEWLRVRRGGSVIMTYPKRGQQKKLLDMVAANANQGLAQHHVKWLSDTNVIQQSLAELQEELSLPSLPRRIECFDISHIQGTNIVGSMVVFQDGRPNPKQYRRFKIRSVEGVDDYASMQEMLRRRLQRLASARSMESQPGYYNGQAKNHTWDTLPDLMLIDGGKGHLTAALEVLLEMGLDIIPLAALAKENEWLFVPHTPEAIILSRNSPALYLVQRARDEAHRFAITYHRNIRSKNSLRSSLDTVTGIGPKRKRLLIRRFGSIQGIKEASVDDITSIPGITKILALRLKQTI
jgi:excinuclease ABC subunit C